MIARIDRWIFEEYPARVADLAIVRVICAAYILLYAVPWATWTIGLPAAFYSPPPGPTALLPAWPAPWVIYGLNALLLASTTAMLVGWRTVTASLLTGVLAITLSGWQYSAGKISHSILLFVTPLALAASGWGKWFSVDSLRDAGSPEAPARAWCLALLALLIAVAMATAGWVKLTTGWLDPATHATYGHLSRFYVQGQMGPLGEFALRVESPWLRELADWSAVWLELGFLVAILRRPVFLGFLVVATVFHLGNVLLFDIPYARNLIAYSAFVSWSLILPVARRSPSRATWAAVALAALAYGSWSIAVGPLLSYRILDNAVVILGAVVAAGYLARLLASLPRRIDPGPSATRPTPDHG